MNSYRSSKIIWICLQILPAFFGINQNVLKYYQKNYHCIGKIHFLNRIISVESYNIQKQTLPKISVDTSIVDRYKTNLQKGEKKIEYIRHSSHCTSAIKKEYAKLYQNERIPSVHELVCTGNIS